MCHNSTAHELAILICMPIQHDRQASSSSTWQQLNCWQQVRAVGAHVKQLAFQCSWCQVLSSNCADNITNNHESWIMIHDYGVSLLPLPLQPTCSCPPCFVFVMMSSTNADAKASTSECCCICVLNRALLCVIVVPG
jgi:hypothetical protein